MSLDYICNKNGCLEIIVSRWYNRTGTKVESFTFSGFLPFEPVGVEVCGEDEEKAKPFNYFSEEAKANPHIEQLNKEKE